MNKEAYILLLDKGTSRIAKLKKRLMYDLNDKDAHATERMIRRERDFLREMFTSFYMRYGFEEALHLFKSHKLNATFDLGHFLIDANQRFYSGSK